MGRGWGIVEKESVEERGCFESKIADSARMVSRAISIVLEFIAADIELSE